MKSKLFFLFVLLVAFVTPNLLCHSKEDAFQKSLDDTQNEMYKKIVKERKKIALHSIGIGIIVASVSAFILTKLFDDKLFIYAATVSIFLFVMQKVYFLTPKSNYIVKHLKNTEQTNLWMDQYRSMQICYHGTISVLFSLVIFGVILL